MVTHVGHTGSFLNVHIPIPPSSAQKSRAEAQERRGVGRGGKGYKVDKW